MLHRELRVTVEGRPPSMNDTNRQVQAQRWRVRREWRATAAAVGREAIQRWERRHGLRWATLTECIVEVLFVVPRKGRRDWDNLASTIKPLLDGLVDSGVIVDDSQECIVTISLWIEHQKGRDATVFTVREA